jgi:hypothetical protein
MRRWIGGKTVYGDMMSELDVTVMELERTYRKAERAARFTSLRSKESQIARAVMARVAAFLRKTFRTERRISGSARKRLSY